jgi:pimeloyl-ACP methyl ester carboxylesterase
MLEYEVFTSSGLRMRRMSAHPGILNWLLLPGGPGLGSESLHELLAALALPGTTWLVDLPGDGSNRRAAAGAGWPGVLLEAVAALPNCVYVGHSTGGMYLQSVPELEARLRGLALVGSAPDASWREGFALTALQHPLPGVPEAALALASGGSDQALGALVQACAGWSFMPETLSRGRKMLARLPYNHQAYRWSEQFFDDSYVGQWWPKRLPTMVLHGACDRIIGAGCWSGRHFHGGHVLHRVIANAGHFPWFEQPAAVHAAFQAFALRIDEEG